MITERRSFEKNNYYYMRLAYITVVQTLYIDLIREYDHLTTVLYALGKKNKEIYSIKVCQKKLSYLRSFMLF